MDIASNVYNLHASYIFSRNLSNKKLILLLDNKLNTPNLSPPTRHIYGINIVYCRDHKHSSLLQEEDALDLYCPVRFEGEVPCLQNAQSIGMIFSLHCKPISSKLIQQFQLCL